MIIQMRKLLALLLASFIFVCGCVSTTPIHFAEKPLDADALHKTAYIDQNVSQTQEDAIIEAMLEWQCTTNGKVHFDIVLHATYENSYRYITNPTASLVVMNVPASHPDIITSDKQLIKNGQYTLGLYDHEAGIPEILFVEKRIKPNEYKIVAMHEVGHGLGIQHLKEKNSIMNASIDTLTDHITRNDLIEFCNLYWCDEKEMHQCE
jgi:predicted Zn-dependent protease